MKKIVTIAKLIVLLLLAGRDFASAQSFFRVMSGIPHLPVMEPEAISSPETGMLIYSPLIKKPLLYAGTGWADFCTTGISGNAAVGSFEVTGGIPYLSALSSDPVGDVEPGAVYLSVPDGVMKVHNGLGWQKMALLQGKGNFTFSSDYFSTSSLKISKLPVLGTDPAPAGLEAGALYINSSYKVIRYYDGNSWQDISCTPVVSTIDPAEITNTSAKSGAYITGHGGSPVNLEGIIWSTSPVNLDTLLTSKTRNLVPDPVGMPLSSPHILPYLKASTTYYVRAYAVNGSGIAYGDIKSFTTAAASVPTIITLASKNETPISGQSGGDIPSTGGEDVSSRGIIWSIKGDPLNDTAATKTTDGSGPGYFESSLTGLLENTRYYVRAYATNKIGTAYGQLEELITPAATPPVLSMPNKVFDNTATSAKSEVIILNNGGSVVLERGLAWSTVKINEWTYGDSNITHQEIEHTASSDIGTFPGELTGLTPGTKYYVRGYARNRIGISYTSETSFITTSLPTLTTADATEISGFMALSGGQVTSTGASALLSRGMVWSTSPQPTIDLATKITYIISEGQKGTGIFTGWMRNLEPDTTYYVRAFATNALGVSYGQEISFITASVPVVETVDASMVTIYGAVSGGKVTDDGRQEVTGKGICWSTSPEPTLADNYTVNGYGNAPFNSNITGLRGSTRYYVRAYATNSVGTAYGQQEDFITDEPVKSTVITHSVPNTDATSINGSGTISADGGGTVTSRGICWNTTGNPTLDDNFAESGAGTGSFSATIYALIPNTTYYVRAYAVNAAGAAYGNLVIFRTYTYPSIITKPADNVSNTTADGGGIITSDGGDEVTSSGIVWNTRPTPTTALSTKTSAPKGIGEFTHQMTRLLGDRVYYVRAYAVNRAGTAYGNEVEVRTPSPVAPAVTTVKVSDVSGTTAAVDGRVDNHGGAGIEAYGLVWSTVPGFDPVAETGNRTLHTSADPETFTSTITGLLPGATYYVRAYATNSRGTTYGAELRFETLDLPVVITADPMIGIDRISAKAGGSISSTGGTPLTRYGLCWSTRPLPAIDDHIVGPQGTSSSFTGTITGLRAATVYYVRAFATNSAGTAYGDPVAFRTLDPVQPVVKTLNVTAITYSSALMWGEISDDGGADVTTRGFVWSTQSGFDPAAVPTSHRTAQTGYYKGTFSSEIRGLLPGTRYYVRAYAENIAGISYGAEVTIEVKALIPPVVVTNSIHSLTGTSVGVNGSITDDGGSEVTVRGVVWSIHQDFDPAAEQVNRTEETGSGSSAITASITGLDPGTTYYVRAYATNGKGTTYGNSIGFQTLRLATVSTRAEMISISSSSARGGGTVSSNGGSAVVRNGLCWSTFPNPTTADNISMPVGSGTGSFTPLLSNLLGNTTYYVRAYAENSAGTAYGQEISFRTLDPVPPTLTTTVATDITGTTAVSGGTITDDGGASVTLRGIVWSTNAEFDPALEMVNRIALPEDAGATFSSTITGLQPGTFYYVRAYAANTVGSTVYGNVISFETPTVPTVSTKAASFITHRTATSGGHVTSDGKAKIEKTGIVWSTVENFIPDLNGVNVTNQAGGADFTSEVKDLIPNTRYYVRAYASNMVGTAFGQQVSFRTAVTGRPTVSTLEPSNITGTSVISGGNITDDGGDVLTTRGIVWSTVSGFDPVADAVSRIEEAGSATGSFRIGVADLVPGTTYYIRAYAENGVGIGYGEEVRFTMPNVPVLATVLTSFTGTNALGGGEAISNEGGPIFNYGVVWSTAPMPTTGLFTRTQQSGAPGISFSSELTELKPKTRYYVRAYASNIVGTGYGNEVVFETDPVAPTVSTSIVNVLDETTAIGGGNISFNGGGTIEDQGLVWSTDPTFDPEAGLLKRTHIDAGGGSTFTHNMTGLQQRVRYYVRAYATNEAGTGYGDPVEFTLFATSPVLSTLKTIDITDVSAAGNGEITNDGGSRITQWGVVWSTERNPNIQLHPHTIINNPTSKTFTGSFSSQITNLERNTRYYIRAWARNGAGVGYGLEENFITAAPPTLSATLDVISGTTTATSGGEITDTGRMPILARGIVWSIYEDPTIALATKTVDKSSDEAGVFTAEMTGLLPDTYYYVRAYATNSVGTTYGTAARFSTKALMPPTVATDSVTEVTATTAKGFGVVIDGGGLDVTARGLVWSTDPEPAFGTSAFVVSGSGTGTFDGGMAGLQPNTQYYMRAFATNSKDTAYGDELAFKTEIDLPKLSAVTVFNLTMSSADVAASVTSTGGVEIDKRGFVWNTSGEPVLENGQIIEGQGSDSSFNGSFTGLEEGKVYYVRAFATNVKGTAYGPVEQIVICPPNIQVMHLAGLNGAVSDKTVTYNVAGSGMTGQGICWLTQNLGADQSAGAATDATEASAGWYFQFNRSQGYTHNGTTRAPATATWVTTINEESNWLKENDPCNLLLAGGWRLPTGSEWESAGVSQAWTSAANAYSSVLKLHTAGMINSSGNLSGRGSSGYYWSSTSGSATNGTYFNIASARTADITKLTGLPVRCVRDKVEISAPVVSAVTVSDMTATTADVSAAVALTGGADITERGFVWNTTGDPLAEDNDITGAVSGIRFNGRIEGLQEGPVYYIRGYATNSAGLTGYGPVQQIVICPPTIEVMHLNNTNGAPEAKTVTYGVVGSSIAGKGLCWITQNLGATQGAGAWNDATEASAGWYFQFNRMQGYKHDGTTRTPNTTWTTTINEESDWLKANDPCNLLLAGGWRLPLGSEWEAADASQGWTYIADAYNSVLKLHGAGYISTAGNLTSRGANAGYYWSNKSVNTTTATVLNISTGRTAGFAKANGAPVRCVREKVEISTPVVSAVSVSTLTDSTATISAVVAVTGGAEITERGFVWNSTGDPDMEANVVKASGSSFTAILSGLKEGMVYYVRAYAKNSAGTGFGPVEQFVICPPSIELTHIGGVSGAPVTKTVTYGVVSSNMTGNAMCWITQNVGADRQATMFADASDAAAGWYFQFNRMQGYQTTGSVRTPNTTWITAISEVGDWKPENDPCNLLLSGGWRLPTATEWTNAAASGKWVVNGDAFASVIKLHAAGFYNQNGAMSVRGSYGYYWSSTANNANVRYGNYFTGLKVANTGLKEYGLPVRCVRDKVEISAPQVTPVSISNMTKTTADVSAVVAVAGGAPVTERGFVWNTTGDPDMEANVVKASGSSFTTILSGLKEGMVYYVRAYAKNSAGTGFGPVEQFVICPPSIEVTHIEGVSGAPVTKTVTYGVVSSNMTDNAMCWITQNLGADRQANAYNDSDEAAAGWYFQFNRKQGYKHDRTTRTPNTAWIGSTSENSDWVAENDPCRLLLSGGWRLPTGAEWTNADNSRGWTSIIYAYNSVLKLHDAGSISSNGTFGGGARYWSSSQATATTGTHFYGNVSALTKVQATPVRCVRDKVEVSAPQLTPVSISNMTKTSADVSAVVAVTGGAPVTERGFVWNSTGDPDMEANVVKASGSSFTGTMTGLAEGPVYYVRAYATNSAGLTGFGPVEKFSICPQFTVQHYAAGKVAPVDREITYTPVSSTISGSALCWLTQNLGAPGSASGPKDPSDAAAGWYWQFNRSQGYQMDGTTRTPNITWPTTYLPSEAGNWTPANDPCSLLLGGGWRLPTATEWTNADAAEGWANSTQAYASTLKLHAAGNISVSGLQARGTTGYYWSSEELDASYGKMLAFHDSDSYVYRNTKTYGKSVRCVRDHLEAVAPTVGGVTVSEMTTTTAVATAGVISNTGVAVKERGLVWGLDANVTLEGSNLGSIVIPDEGGSISGQLTGLQEGPSYYVRAFARNIDGGLGYGAVSQFVICPPSIEVTHIAGVNGAPVDKTVKYGVVSSDMSGQAMCWLTQNLGADRQATAYTDNTEPSAGWYFQFNRKQGYKHDGSTRTPNTTWVTSISEASDWTPENDPCGQLLSGGWRLPTGSEWTEADAKQGWKGIPAAYGDILKLHNAGFLDTYGRLATRGGNGFYWSSTQGTNAASGTSINNSIVTGSYSKAYGIPVRCVRSEIVLTKPSLGEVTLSNMTETSMDVAATVTSTGGGALTASGFVWNTTGEPALTDSVIQGGNTQKLAGTIAGIEEGPVYYVRAYATNSAGLTAYGPVKQFVICPPAMEIKHLAGVNGAPVDKTVLYGTTTSTLSGKAMCWLTQNLGSDRAATSGYEGSELPAGWYFQFNRKQGFKSTGQYSRTPADAWITNITEDKNWEVENDPCRLMIGGGWRLPTSSEWAGVASQKWSTYVDAYNSELKLHQAGYIDQNGQLLRRGQSAAFWSGTQYNTNLASSFKDRISTQIGKYLGLSVRCVRDEIEATPPTVTGITVTDMTTNSANAGSVVALSGGASITERGFVWNTTGDPKLGSATAIKENPAGTGKFSLQLSGLSVGPIYYIRAYATNSAGLTGYGDIEEFVLCPPTVAATHDAGVNGAPVSKSVNYGVVGMSGTTGGNPLCWITQNLGADGQATGWDDVTEASAGWYYQFNRMQGYKHDGTTRTPGDAWTIPAPANNDWSPEEDPCKLLLGGGWRLPTAAEWRGILAGQGWKNIYDSYSSPLRLHAGGLLASYGQYGGSGNTGQFWSSSLRPDTTIPEAMQLNATASGVIGGTNHYGYTVRCVK